MAYRGTSVLPNVLHCALMALETWLLELCENGTPIESWLTKLLVDSNSVMTTALIASVCNAYPTSGGTTALALLTAREVFPMDLRRMVKERDAAILSAFPALIQCTNFMATNVSSQTRWNTESTASKR